MQVGDYVRTTKGEIGKIIGYVDEPTDYYFNCYVTTLKANFTDTYITEYDNNIKSSPNILELLRVGDFINGKQIVKIIHFEGDTFYRIELFGGKAIMNIKDIKSIVTKEQFESMEYKVGVDKE